jgi:hypothetical protein
MKLLWCLVCRSSAIDQATNALSVFEVVEELQVHLEKEQAFPEGVLVQREMSFIALLARSKDTPENHDVQLRMISPINEIAIGKMVVDLASHERFRLLARMPGIPYFGDGTYAFVLSDSAGGEVGRASLEVTTLRAGE